VIRLAIVKVLFPHLIEKPELQYPYICPLSPLEDDSTITKPL
jgi:hypothetical protein